MNAIVKVIAAISLCTLAACASMSDPVWIDVRTVEEYSENHIGGDLNIPLATIDVDAFAAAYGKDDEINLYCRSGNRAGQAKEILEAAGFTNVNNMGGIDDVKQLRSLAEMSSSP
jgi:phage shock protein E